jgi:hypothetical protein
MMRMANISVTRRRVHFELNCLNSLHILLRLAIGEKRMNATLVLAMKCLLTRSIWSQSVFCIHRGLGIWSEDVLYVMSGRNDLPVRSYYLSMKVVKQYEIIHSSKGPAGQQVTVILSSLPPGFIASPDQRRQIRRLWAFIRIAL